MPFLQKRFNERKKTKKKMVVFVIATFKDTPKWFILYLHQRLAYFPLYADQHITENCFVFGFSVLSQEKIVETKRKNESINSIVHFPYKDGVWACLKIY